MEKFPFDERLGHGDGEDVIWSKQVLETYNFEINEHATVQLLIQARCLFQPASDYTVQFYRNLSNQHDISST
jgi:hypothetical protein